MQLSGVYNMMHVHVHVS